MSSVYGLIGYPLNHSFSPGYFAEKFRKEGIDAAYKLFPLSDIRQFTNLLSDHPELCGLNVTIPYKQSVIPYLDSLNKDAEEIGAVNCISIINGQTVGHNTDIIGFEQSLIPLLQPQHNTALVLGKGGASLAVMYVLRKLGITAHYVSRSTHANGFSYEELTPDIVSQHKLIINTTPLGMHPHTDACAPIPYHAIGSKHLLYDLIYNPAETSFLRNGKQQGASIKNGLEMLELQAEASWHIWNSK